MGNSVYIVSVDAKDLFLANYSSPNSKEYSVKLAGSDHNDQFNTRRFVNTLDYSLDLIKLREVYEKVYRRMDFTFSKRGKEYCRRVINVTFKYSVKEFNRFFDNTYIKYGYLPQDVHLTDNICIKDGELIAVRVGSPVENPASPQELGDLFVFDNGMYRLGKTMKVLLTVAQLRNRLYQDGFTCDGIVFRRFKRSSGSSRIGKCLFIDEQLYPRMHKWELCGLKVKEGQEIDLAALEAYIALTLSSIVGTIPLRPENFLVIDDHNICAAHGDLDNVKNAGKTLHTLFAKKYSSDIDYVVLADKHHKEEFEELGIESMIAPCLCGTDDYANGKRLYSTPAQLMMVFRPGVGADACYQIKLN